MIETYLNTLLTYFHRAKQSKAKQNKTKTK